jgi:hypothetical protein
MHHPTAAGLPIADESNSGKRLLPARLADRPASLVLILCLESLSTFAHRSYRHRSAPPPAVDKEPMIHGSDCRQACKSVLPSISAGDWSSWKAPPARYRWPMIPPGTNGYRELRPARA